jgi:hypothetical protein
VIDLGFPDKLAWGSALLAGVLSFASPKESIFSWRSKKK